MRLSIKIMVVMLAIAATGAWRVAGQFTIQHDGEVTATPPPVVFAPKPAADIKGEYFDPAAWRAQKKREWLERNTIEFNSKISTSLQRYEKWSASVDNNFSFEATAYFSHKYRRNKFSLDYTFDSKYGMTIVSDPEAVATRDNFYKNRDEMKFNLQMGWAMRESWSYSATANLRTQFTKGYPSRTDNTLISNFMAPGYFDVAVGFTYNKDNGPFRVTLSPLSGSVTTVWDTAIWESVADGGSKYGVRKGERYTGHIGPSVEVQFDRRFGKRKNFRYRSTFYAFTSYAHPWNTPLIRWDNTLDMKISRYVTASLYGQAYYKKEDKDWVQYQYAFTIGLAYGFKNK